MDPLTFIILILICAWVFGIGVGVTAGGLIHILLVLALVVLLVRLIKGMPL